MRVLQRGIRVVAAVGLVAGASATVATSSATSATAASNAASDWVLSPNMAIAVGPAGATLTSSPGCNLGGAQHVIYVGFDNFHLRRDNSNTVANNGDDNHTPTPPSRAISSRFPRCTTSSAGPRTAPRRRTMRAARTRPIRTRPHSRAGRSWATTTRHSSPTRPLTSPRPTAGSTATATASPRRRTTWRRTTAPTTRRRRPTR
jgi:hypothetical protein